MIHGAAFPMTANWDVSTIRIFAQELDRADVGFVTVSGHSLSRPPDSYPGRPNVLFNGPYHDPFVLFSYLAAITETLTFRTSILILPLFPTVLVAKQAAELSLLSAGRFELGVGVSWNDVEYAAFGQDPCTRGARLEEQLNVLQQLWTTPFVTFHGRFHDLEGIGLNRLPERPPKIWMGGGTSDLVMRRIATRASGWIPMGDPTPRISQLHRFLEAAGRNPAQFGLTCKLTIGTDDAGQWVTEARRLRSLGATHLLLDPGEDHSARAMLDRILAAHVVLSEVAE